MARRKGIFEVNKKFINNTIDKSKVVVSEGVAHYKIIAVSLVINAATIVVVFALKKFLPPQVPLLYGLAEGEGQLVNTSSLVLPSLISTIIVLVNTAISLVISDDYLQKALVVTALASSIIASIAVLEVIFLVGNL